MGETCLLYQILSSLPELIHVLCNFKKCEGLKVQNFMLKFYFSSEIVEPETRD